MPNPEEIRRLQWRCRRGVLELDVILERFLDERYPALPEADKASFVRLLECTDPELLGWLVNGEEPEEQGLQAIVKLIQLNLP